MSARVRPDRRLVLEAPQDTPDGAGGMQRGWLVLGELWGQMRARAAGRAAASGDGGAAPVTRVRWEITLRAAPPGAVSRPQPGQRFRAGARLFHIRAVVEDGPAWLICHAEQEEVLP